MSRECELVFEVVVEEEDEWEENQMTCLRSPMDAMVDDCVVKYSDFEMAVVVATAAWDSLLKANPCHYSITGWN